ncbi:DUF6364 family protein [Shivajiella indica]|uniref:DUF6364 family protein n=1 Tax=Shivajiella indica TaxID=872115 RepID=A0ABW5BBI8_9BACT
MKTKLTLTIKKTVIDTAKQRAKARGISLSRMIEEIFEDSGENAIKTEPQRAAERLLKTLEKSVFTDTLSDEDLLKEQVKRKFA